MVSKESEDGRFGSPGTEVSWTQVGLVGEQSVETQTEKEEVNGKKVEMLSDPTVWP